MSSTNAGDGLGLGDTDGEADGLTDGETLGEAEGDTDGDALGDAEGLALPPLDSSVSRLMPHTPTQPGWVVSSPPPSVPDSSVTLTPMSCPLVTARAESRFADQPKQSMLDWLPRE